MKYVYSIVSVGLLIIFSGCASKHPNIAKRDLGDIVTSQEKLRLLGELYVPHSEVVHTIHRKSYRKNKKAYKEDIYVDTKPVIYKENPYTKHEVPIDLK